MVFFLPLSHPGTRRTQRGDAAVAQEWWQFFPSPITEELWISYLVGLQNSKFIWWDCSPHIEPKENFPIDAFSLFCSVILVLHGRFLFASCSVSYTTKFPILHIIMWCAWKKIPLTFVARITEKVVTNILDPSILRWLIYLELGTIINQHWLCWNKKDF